MLVLRLLRGPLILDRHMKQEVHTSLPSFTYSLCLIPENYCVVCSVSAPTVLHKYLDYTLLFHSFSHRQHPLWFYSQPHW